jgi:hypothetical protein
MGLAREFRASILSAARMRRNIGPDPQLFHAFLRAQARSTSMDYAKEAAVWK